MDGLSLSSEDLIENYEARPILGRAFFVSLFGDLAQLVERRTENPRQPRFDPESRHQI